MPDLPHWLRRILVAVALGSLAAGFLLAGSETLISPHSIDLLFWLRHQVAGPVFDQKASPVAVVVIDEETYDDEELKELPQVAWTPHFATVLGALDKAGVKSIGLDVVYPTTLESLAPGRDRAFLRAIARLARPGRLIMGQVNSSRQKILPHPGQIAAIGGNENLGTLQLFSDSDNVVRRHIAETIEDGERVTTLVGELANRAGVHPPARYIINYDTGGNGFPIYSFADLLACAAAGPERAAFFEKAFKDRVVLFGTALDVEDRRIPATYLVGNTYTGPTARCTDRRADAPTFGDSVERRTVPGVFMHAAALQTVLQDRRLVEPPRLVRAAGTFVFAGVGTLAFLSLGPLSGLVAVAVAVVAVVAVSLGAFIEGVVLPMNTLLAAALSCAGVVYLYRFIEELRARRKSEAAKKELSTRFGRYLAPAIIAQLDNDPAALRLGGDKRRVTVFFSDIVGYTTMSEKLQDRPETLVEIVNGYFTLMVEIIERHDGYIDKFIGDAVMAVWGAPLKLDDPEVKSVTAALECASALVRYNAEVVVGKYGLPALGARIGLNTGEVIVGNMGSPNRLSYTVTGDTVNLASRLEGANKAYGTKLMVGPETAEAVRGVFLMRTIDKMTVKGKKQPVSVHEVICRLDAATAEQRGRVETYEAALALYTERHFEAASTAFKQLADATGDELSAVYVRRCDHYLKNPPPDAWDGAFELTEK